MSTPPDSQLEDPPVATGGGDEPPGSLDEFDLDDVDVRDLLRAALDEDADWQRDTKLVAGVHERIREATGGRYFADGWSRAQQPVLTFVATSVVMLLVIAVMWLMLLPVEVQDPPAKSAPNVPPASAEPKE